MHQKRNIPIAVLLIAVMLLPSCEKKIKYTLSVSPTSVFLDNGASSATVQLSTNGSWEASSNSDWLQISPSSGKGDQTVTFSAGANPGAARAATVTFSATGAGDRSVTVSQSAAVMAPITPIEKEWDGTKRASTTYQLLVYSFCDSDGDGVGDFNGISSKMDYFDGLGVTGLWLSPIHPTGSYHGYDVNDYAAVNPKFGTEADFKAMLDAAHAHGIEVYLDYVLNHSGKGHPWFREAVADASSPYRDYYFFSSNPSADYGTFPMLTGTSYNSGEWKATGAGAGAAGRFKFVLDASGSTITVSRTDEEPYTGSPSSQWNLWYGSVTDSTFPYFRADGGNIYSMVLDFESDWGFLIRSAASWGADDANKYGGAEGKQLITFDVPFKLTRGSGARNIIFAEQEYYMAAFDQSMPDLNYGDLDRIGDSGAFSDIAASADKWIKMGVDGFRLDAVKHICGGISSYNSASNVKFLKAWYDHCNATRKAEGHGGEMFMVGEVFNEYNDGSAPYSDYLGGLPSVFDFSFWWRLSEALNRYSGSDFASELETRERVYSGKGGIASLKLSNHDEDRTGEILGKSPAKEKQAAAVLLTAPGKPFIYQGEELGYYGSKGGGDEYVRTPMNWDGGSWADALLGGKTVAALKSKAFSVEAQSGDGDSVLSVYKAFSEIRNSYPALASGSMSVCGFAESAIAAWYMSDTAGKRMLVMHNLSNSAKAVTVSDDMSKPVVLLGSGSVLGNALTLGANSSVVFKLY